MPFIVQLRSLEDHSVLPGLEIGDIGPKYGYEFNDNGFARFEHVRIPRTDMLMRFTKLSRDGVLTRAKNDKITYVSMVNVRVSMIREMWHKLGRAVTVATRFSAVRRQFKNPADPMTEMQVLDYQMQQRQLFPLLASAYAFHSTGEAIRKMYDQFKKEVAENDMSMMAEVHATTCCLKSVMTTIVCDGIEKCRKLCGGHGYSRFSGLIDLFSNYVPSQTYEGENTILMLQTARFLLKMASAVSSGRNVQGATVNYLNKFLLVHNIPSGPTVEQEGGCANLEFLVQAFQARAIFLIKNMALEFTSQLRQHKGDQEKAALEVQVAMVRASRAHACVILLSNFVSALNGVPKPLAPVLSKLCSLFGLSMLVDDSGDFVEHGFESMSEARETLLSLLRDIRKDAVPLVDAFGFSDHFLNSALGRFDGNAYQALYEWAKKEPLNQEDLPPGYERFLKPMLQGKL